MKNKTQKIFLIAITAIMLLSVFVAMMPAIAIAATGESVEEAQAQTSLAIDNPAAVYSAGEEREKEIQRIHEERLGKLKQGTLGAYIHEAYPYSLGSEKLIKGHYGHAPWLYIELGLHEVDVDEVRVDLQLPAGITPEYDHGYIPEEIYYDEATGEFSVIYDTSEIEEEWIKTSFNLPELELGFDPFDTVPLPSATPGYCALGESGEVTISLSPATLTETYDWGWIELEVRDVKSISIIETTPEADDQWTYNDTEPWDGHYDSCAHATWDYGGAFESLPEHTMRVYLQNDKDAVRTWFHYDVGKNTGTNVEIIDIITEPDVAVDSGITTEIHPQVEFDLDPASPTVTHGLLNGTASTETGAVLSGAQVHIGKEELGITKITDENGNYSVMLPPWLYGIEAYYGFVPYSDEYGSEHYDVMVWGTEPIVQDLTLYKVPTVKMTIDPIDNDLTDGIITYDVIIENTGDKTEHIHLWGSDWAFDSTEHWFHEILEWGFSENDFDLASGDTRVVRADAEFVGTEPLDWEKYAFQIECEPESDDIRGYYYLKDFFEVHGVFDVIVDADKEEYTIGEIIQLGMRLESHGGPYMIDLGIDVEHLGDEWNYWELKGAHYPPDYIWEGAIPIAIPASKLMPPGDYEFIVRVRDSTTGQLLGEDSDRVRIEHGKIMEKITIESFDFE